MNRNKAILKYREIERSQEKRKQYRLHMERQRIRLERIATLLKLSWNDARELTDLLIEYQNGTGAFKQGSNKIVKRIT